MSTLYMKEEVFALVAALFEVHNEQGPGFLEPVYQECLGIELELRDIPFVEMPQLSICYKGRVLKKKYEPDFVCHNEIIIELKACKTLEDGHRAQLINYLKATGHHLGLLVNFGAYPKLQWERIVYSTPPDSAPPTLLQ